MRPTAVLARALVRPAVVLTTEGAEGGGEGEGGGGEGGGEGGGGEGEGGGGEGGGGESGGGEGEGGGGEGGGGEGEGGGGEGDGGGGEGGEGGGGGVAVCSSRRWLGTSCMEYSPATGWSLGTAPAKTIRPEGPGGGGVHVPHATGQVIRAME